jgi:hypothetical protein
VVCEPLCRRRRLGRQPQQAASRCLAPGRQMLRREAMLACHFRRDRARQKGFRNDPPLDVPAPAATTSRLDPAPRLRNVNYMVDHRCEPICVGWFVSCSSARRRQCGDRRPLTVQEMSGCKDRQAGTAPKAAVRSQPHRESARSSPNRILSTPIEPLANHPTNHKNLITDEC